MSTKRDYYDVLGIGRDASADDVKSAYRQIALKNHPDRNPGDAAAEQRFKEAAEAYAVLGDATKRARYDQFGHAGVGGPAGGGGAGFSNLDDIFAHFGDLFGGRGGGAGFFEQFFGGGRQGRQRRGASLRVDLALTLEEVAKGAKKTLDISRPEACETCGGSGAKPGSSPRACTTCGGHGQVTVNQGFLSIRQACPACRGQGTVIDTPCGRCRGRGAVAKKSPLNISIPPGIEEGHVERIAGQGEPGEQGGPPGDLVVVIHIEPHSYFVRQGDDLHAMTTISFRQAALGDSVEIPTLTEDSVVLKIPPGTQPGERLRVRNHGLPRADGYGKGNLVVQVQVAVPRKLTAEQQELIERLDDAESSKGKNHAKKKSILDKVKDIFQ